MHAKETALLSVYKYLSGQQLKRVRATKKICGFFLVWCRFLVRFGFFFLTYLQRIQETYRKNHFCLTFLLLNKTYQNLILYISDYRNQLYGCKKADLLLLGFIHCPELLLHFKKLTVFTEAHTHTRCSFDNFYSSTYFKTQYNQHKAHPPV